LIFTGRKIKHNQLTIFLPEFVLDNTT